MSWKVQFMRAWVGNERPISFLWCAVGPQLIMPPLSQGDRDTKCLWENWQEDYNQPIKHPRAPRD